MADDLRCRRCYFRFDGPGYLMAGQQYCCKSCSVGSTCIHQNTMRPSAVRRFDSNFRPFRAVVQHSSPYEPRRIRE